MACCSLVFAGKRRLCVASVPTLLCPFSARINVCEPVPISHARGVRCERTPFRVESRLSSGA